jgi:hypothetical protein
VRGGAAWGGLQEQGVVAQYEGSRGSGSGINAIADSVDHVVHEPHLLYR